MLLVQACSTFIYLLWVSHEQVDNTLIVVLRCSRKEGSKLGACYGRNIDNSILSSGIGDGRCVRDELR